MLRRAVEMIVHDVAQSEILLDAQEIGLHQIVELQEDEYRLVFVVREQFAPLAQLLGVDRVGVEVVVHGERDAGVIISGMNSP